MLAFAFAFALLCYHVLSIYVSACFHFLNSFHALCSRTFWGFVRKGGRRALDEMDLVS